MKRTECTARSYVVAITVKQFLAVEARDEKTEHTLGHVLSNMGAAHIEYNGHFGAAIHYTLTNEDDTPELRTKIEKAIVAYAKGWRTGR